MFGSRFLVAMSIFLLMAPSSASFANEQMRPLAVSGDWATFAYSSSMLAPPSVCLVLNPTRGIALRAAPEGIEFRVMNDKWSLPTRVKGTIGLVVGDWRHTIEINHNSDVMVSGRLESGAVLALFAAMDKNSSMTAVVGNDKPLSISLAGSTRATNAFRTCASITGGGKGAGSNPFE